MAKRLLLAATLIFSMCAFPACTSGFQKSWRNAGQPNSAHPQIGRWTGTWQSSSGTHRGQLECVLEPETHVEVLSKTYPYRAHFHAHWNGLSSAYVVHLTGSREGKILKIRGAQDLGALQGGVYEYEGRVSASRFDVAYQSKYDRGMFTLRRPQSTLLHGEKERR